MDIGQLKRDIADHGPSDAQVRGLLEMVKERILAEPETYKQTDFCTTRCCLAGQIDVIINGLRVHITRPRTAETNELILAIAAHAIAADADAWLFGTTMETHEYGEDCSTEDAFEEYDPKEGFWPPDLSDDYEAAPTGTARALVGCKAIDRYMKERGI